MNQVLRTVAPGVQIAVDNPDVFISGFNSYSPLVANNGYIRTVQTIEQFAQKSYYSGLDSLWVQTVASGGTVTHDQGRKVKVISVDGTSGSSAVIQTKQAFPYLPGSTHRYTAGVNASLQVGATARFGTFDSENGYYFQVEKTAGNFNLSVVRRSKASGVVVEEIVPQTDWNLDKLDGSGASGISIDLSKVQMIVIEHTWYGAGGVIFGLEINREYVFCHWMPAGNRLSEFITADSDLPIRYELFNTGETAGASSLSLGGVFLSVDRSESDRVGFTRGILAPGSSVTAGNTYPLLTIQPRLNFLGITNKVRIVLSDIEVFGTAEGNFRLVASPTLTGANYVDVDTNNSAVAYDISATAVSGGVTLYTAGFYSGTRQRTSKGISLSSRDPLVANSDGSGTSWYTLVFECITNGNMGAVFNWSEFY